MAFGLGKPSPGQKCPSFLSLDVFLHLILSYHMDTKTLAPITNSQNNFCSGIICKNDFMAFNFPFKIIYARYREYARGLRERRNRFRPSDLAFFSSDSDKNVALIFRKIRCFNIHFNIHTCHQLVFDRRRSSTRCPSGLHKKIDM